MSVPDIMGPPSAPRVERFRDKKDPGDCMRCGECCMVLMLQDISEAEADRLGRDFCFEVENNPGRWGIRRVPRSWAPAFADEGVCVFLYPDGRSFKCMAREERPEICSKFRCVSRTWASVMDRCVLQHQARVVWDKLSIEKRTEITAKLDELKSLRFF